MYGPCPCQRFRIGLIVVCIGFVVFLTPFDAEKQAETVVETLPKEALVLETVKI